MTVPLVLDESIRHEIAGLGSMKSDAGDHSSLWCGSILVVYAMHVLAWRCCSESSGYIASLPAALTSFFPPSATWNRIPSITISFLPVPGLELAEASDAAVA